MLQPGIYRHPDGAIIRVRLNQGKTRVYSEVWTLTGESHRFIYAPTVIASLRAEHRMPLEEARTISREVGQCLACAKVLTDPRSQEAGIGPTCAKKFDDPDAAVRRTTARIASTRLQTPEQRVARARASVRAFRVGDVVQICSGFDDRIIEIVRTMPGRAWDGSGWTIPLAAVGELAEAFELAGIAHDDLAIIAVGWDQPDDLPVADRRLIVGSPPYMSPAPIGDVS